MNARGKWQGMLTIARFNWPFYVAAIAVMISSLIGWLLLDVADLRVACAIILAAAAYFLVASLSVSHFIYDRSDLYRWGTACHCPQIVAQVSIANHQDD